MSGHTCAWAAESAVSSYRAGGGRERKPVEEDLLAEIRMQRQFRPIADNRSESGRQ